MIFRTPIETSRLLLEQESLLDFERFYGMSVDLEVMKYIGDDILACVHPDNAASIRVLEKLGFRFSHSRLSKPIGRDMPVYRIDRKTYTHLV